jgi:hypothetical protein
MPVPYNKNIKNKKICDPAKGKIIDVWNSIMTVMVIIF